MKLSRDDMVALRKNGDLQGSEYLGLIRQAVKQMKTQEDPVVEDKSQQALIRLATAVEQISKREPEPQDEPELLEPILEEIHNQLEQLATATKQMVAARQKKWSFIPEYSSSGRIIKITAQ